MAANKGAPDAGQPAWMVSLDNATGSLKSAKPAKSIKSVGHSGRTDEQRKLHVPRRTPPAGLGLTAESHRERMIQACIEAGVRHPAVLNAMRAVERHHFVDEALASRAYEDCALPIGLEQSISKPTSVALMLEYLLRRTDDRPIKSLKALEVGTGSGYQAAVMAHLFGEVYSIERLRKLADLARDNLRPLRLGNLRLILGDGQQGLPEAAPFDAIILAAAGVQIPDALLNQLAVGGLLIAPVGADEQRLHWIERRGPQQWYQTELETARFVPLRTGVR